MLFFSTILTPVEDRRFGSLKEMFVRDHSPHMFVADAERMGNVSRFFNHSCRANLVGQNVFHDTHDVRLPLFALFTSEFVAAGQVGLLHKC